MRIIGGTAKGARLAPAPAGVRPLSDRAREGLFSSLGESVIGARVLDLYAGTGAIGVEALSRGAERATFVESDKGAIRTIRANLDRTGFAGAASVVAGDVLTHLRSRGPHPAGLCFLDPPYAAPLKQVETALSLLGEGWLSPGFTVALTRPVRGSTLVTPLNWHVARRLEYGDSLVILYREV